jgi:hypothetical protein
MGPFVNITREKVTALHILIRFLRRLDVIGKVHTTTMSQRMAISAMDFAEGLPDNSYTVHYDGYDPDKHEMKSEMLLEDIFDHRMMTDGWNTHFKF